MGKAILDNMLDIGTDVLIFNRFLNYFKAGDYETCKKFNADNIQWLHKQPLKEEILMYYNLIHQYIEIIESQK